MMKESKTILCFGDSNTWGYRPLNSRYPAAVRWPGRLADLLGAGFQVAADGICGRCAGSYEDLPAELCGKPSLQAALSRRAETDWLVILLGTNDLMNGHAASLEDLAAGLGGLVRQAEGRARQIVLTAPPRILDGVDPDWGFAADAPQKSARLAVLCRRTAELCGCRFLDGSGLEVSRRDGLHLRAAGHEALAQGIAELIMKEGRL